jgi:hypothetical protein
MAKVSKVMKEFKAGKLHSGSKKGPVVKSKAELFTSTDTLVLKS